MIVMMTDIAEAKVERLSPRLANILFFWSDEIGLRSKL